MPPSASSESWPDQRCRSLPTHRTSTPAHSVATTTLRHPPNSQNSPGQSSPTIPVTRTPTPHRPAGLPADLPYVVARYIVRAPSPQASCPETQSPAADRSAAKCYGLPPCGFVLCNPRRPVLDAGNAHPSPRTLPQSTRHPLHPQARTPSTPKLLNSSSPLLQVFCGCCEKETPAFHARKAGAPATAEATRQTYRVT